MSRIRDSQDVILCVISVPRESCFEKLRRFTKKFRVLSEWRLIMELTLILEAAMKILIIEDEKLLAASLKTLLEGKG